MPIHSKRKPSDGSIAKIKLARAYAPGLTDHSALNRLNCWLRSHPTLWKALQKHGYSVAKKKFTKKQKEIIFRHLGAPIAGKRVT